MVDEQETVELAVESRCPLCSGRGMLEFLESMQGMDAGSIAHDRSRRVLARAVSEVNQRGGAKVAVAVDHLDGTMTFLIGPMEDPFGFLGWLQAQCQLRMLQLLQVTSTKVEERGGGEVGEGRVQ